MFGSQSGTVSAGTTGSVTMAASTSAFAGSYYFTLTEGAGVSAVTGTAGSVTFAATTANVTVGTAGTITWYPSSTLATPPEGSFSGVGLYVPESKKFT
jgi:hypothetical protein